MTLNPPTGSVDPNSPVGKLDQQAAESMRDLGIELIDSVDRQDELEFPPAPPLLDVKADMQIEDNGDVTIAFTVPGTTVTVSGNFNSDTDEQAEQGRMLIDSLPQLLEEVVGRLESGAFDVIQGPEVPTDG